MSKTTVEAKVEILQINDEFVGGDKHMEIKPHDGHYAYVTLIDDAGKEITVQFDDLMYCLTMCQDVQRRNQSEKFNSIPK